MKLSNLLRVLSKALPAEADLTKEVRGISEDSRNINKGYLFVAIHGLNVDGHKYITQAIKNGAVCVVGEKDEWELKLPSNVPYIKVEDSRYVLGMLSAKFYNNPSRKLKVIGVTGTKGKTTTTHLIAHILEKSGHKTGFISSIKAKIGSKEYETGFHVTNPDSFTLNKFLKEMVKKKCEYAVLEVSSHGIDQHRIAGINFYIAVLTNIAPEHLDYHKNFENYKRVKMSFVNSAKHKVIAPETTKLNILPGDFNNLNVEAALKTVELLGIKRNDAINTLRSFKLPEGRMFEVKNKKGLNIIIDFAHNPSSLEALITHLVRQKNKSQRLIAIFGCASERDESKRPVMGEISTRLADVSIFTTEDPRREDIHKILREMAAGVTDKKAKELDYEDFENSDLPKKLGGHVYFRIPERGEAITFAINKLAKRGDIIAICGKGHEKSMAYNGVEYPWSDEKAVSYALKGKVLEIKRGN